MPAPARLRDEKAVRFEGPGSRLLHREPGSLRCEIVPLGNARRWFRRGPVVRDGAFVVTGHLEEMRANRVEAVMPMHSGIGVEFEPIDLLDSASETSAIPSAIRR